MTRRFTCRGFEGQIRKILYEWATPLFVAYVRVGPQNIEAQGKTEAIAKSRVRRKLDAVERAFRERGRRC